MTMHNRATDRFLHPAVFYERSNGQRRGAIDGSDALHATADISARGRATECHGLGPAAFYKGEVGDPILNKLLPAAIDRRDARQAADELASVHGRTDGGAAVIDGLVTTRVDGGVAGGPSWQAGLLPRLDFLVAAVVDRGTDVNPAAIDEFLDEAPARIIYGRVNGRAIGLDDQGVAAVESKAAARMARGNGIVGHGRLPFRLSCDLVP
jgi:hypothetical protein